MTAGTRAALLARGTRTLRAAPPVERVRHARSARALARTALVPAGRNLGMAIAMLPAGPRDEATAALLACRVLDAFEDLGHDATRIRDAARYLTGDSPVPPTADGLHAHRPSEQLDRALAERIDLVRALVAALDEDRRRRVERLVTDVAAAMAAHAGRRERRAYGGDVLGRTVAYAAGVLTDNSDGDASVHRAVGYLLQLANDLRDDDRAPYGADSASELRYVVFLSSLPGSLAALDLVRSLHRRTPSRGGRVAIAAMTLHTAAFFCRAAGVPEPVPRRARLAHAVLAAHSDGAFERLCRRVEMAADACLNRVVGADDLVLFAAPSRTTERGVAALAVDAATHLIDGLPTAPLRGALPDAHVRALMLADHVVLDAVEPTEGGEPDDLRALADLLQAAAVEP